MTTTLRDALDDPSILKGSWVFLSRDRELWSLDSTCYSFDLKEATPEEDTNDDADLPDEARRLGLRCVLCTGDFEDVVHNARLQRADASDEQLFAAFLYYYEYDAFLEL